MIDTRQRNSIVIEVDGQRYTGWTHASVKKSIENLCGSFSFISTASKEFPFPVKQGQNCRIFVNDILFLTGWIEKIRVKLSKDSHTITVSGRDRTNDVVDSQMSHIDFNSNSTLKKMTEAVLKELNLNGIKVIDRFNLSKFDDIETDALGMTGFNFLERYAKKKQVLLTTNGDGDIVFERASTKKLKTILTTDPMSDSRIFSSDVIYDDSKRFNEYKAVCQENSAGLAFLTKLGLAKLGTNVHGEVFDLEIRTSRKYVFQPEDNGDTNSNIDRAIWEANFRSSQSMIYRTTVFGFQPFNDEGIWETNTLVKVKDDLMNINDTNSTLLITEVGYTQDNDNGSFTHLKLMNRLAFTTIVSKPSKDKKDYTEGTVLKKREPQKS